MRKLNVARLITPVLLAGSASALLMMALPTGAAAESVVTAPAPLVDAKPAGAQETAIFAGGCFWGVEGVFSHIKGVISAESGYAGGPAALKVGYEDVGSGTTGYAESVRVVFDPKQVSYGTLLRIFFSVATDPTTLNYQGPDHGTQYRSALFPQNPEQDKVARAYLAQLGKTKLWDGKIVTTLEKVGKFQPAESYHQNFFERNPTHPYIVHWDAPKVAALKSMYPAMYTAKPSA